MNSDQVRHRIAILAERRVEHLLSTVPPLTSDKSKVTGADVQKERERLEAFKKRKTREIEMQLTDVARTMAEVSVVRLDS